MNDLDMKGTAYENTWIPIGDSLGTRAFTGSFNGQGYTIHNLVLDTAVSNGSMPNDIRKSYFTGLFGVIDSAVLKNLILDSVGVTGKIAGENGAQIYTSALCAYAYGGSSIDSCKVMSGTVTAGFTATTNVTAYTGALCGILCVRANTGIVEGAISHCANGAEVKNVTSGTLSNSYTGGIIGSGSGDGSGSVTVYDCENSGSVTGGGIPPAQGESSAPAPAPAVSR